MTSKWAENNTGQRAELERLEFNRLAIDIMRAQLKARKAAGAAAVDRAFHAKSLLAVDQATVTFRSDLPQRAGDRVCQARRILSRDHPHFERCEPCWPRLSSRPARDRGQNCRFLRRAARSAGDEFPSLARA